MSAIDYVVSNFKWTFSKQFFTRLLCQPISQESLWILLERNSSIWKDYCDYKNVQLNYTEFCLNDIALSSAQNKVTQRLKILFPKFWQDFLRVKNSLGNKRITFAAKQQPRIEEAVELFVTATQLNYTEEMWSKYKQDLSAFVNLSQREISNLDNMLALWSIRYYCALYRAAQTDEAEGQRYMCNLTDCAELLSGRYICNDYYSKTVFNNGKLLSVVDCLGNSAAIIGNNPRPVALGIRVLCNGRNVFDTFCQHKYGKNTANFMSENNSVRMYEQYYLLDNCEVRHCYLEGGVKDKRVYRVEVDFQSSFDTDHAERFSLGNVQAMGCGTAGGYIALCIVKDNSIEPVTVTDYSNNKSCRMRLAVDYKLKKGQAVKFDVVTIYADSIEELNQTIRRLCSFGYTKCPYWDDSNVTGRLFSRKTGVDSASNLYERFERSADNKVFSFCSRYGENVATLTDREGNGATLINGFAFGIGGEKVFGIANNKVTQLNCGTASTDGLSLTRSVSCDNKVTLVEQHNGSKHYSITSDKPQRVLFVFPLEEQSTITRLDYNCFEVASQTRRFKVECKGVVESFTTNAIECNVRRLRYKLSNDITTGTALSICFASGNSAGLTLTNLNCIPQSRPTIKESLLSTYLNYVNSKNLFGIVNGLEKADALKLASLVYTNPDYVRQVVLNPSHSGGAEYFYYNADGQKHISDDRMAYALATVYYVCITGDKSVLNDNRLRLLKEILWADHQGRNKCVQALALKRFVSLNIDKVDTLIKYGELKRAISADKNLYGYAQAIGAMSMQSPSRQRLKDLCNTYNIPKCWYYVSQVENLYGILVNGSALTVVPNVIQDNVLEKMVLYVCNRRIETEFVKSNVQQLVVNGTPCYRTVDANGLKDNNVLTVRY